MLVKKKKKKKKKKKSRFFLSSTPLAIHPIKNLSLLDTFFLNLKHNCLFINVYVCMYVCLIFSS